MQHDLILRGGRLIDPARNIDRTEDIAFTAGKVALMEPGDTAAQDRDVRGCIVIPGMIDFHAHVYDGGTSISVNADALARKSGTTTWLDAGSAGPGNFAGFRDHVIAHSQTRILAYLHVSHAGIYAFSPTVMVGESKDLALMDTARCAQVARENPQHIRGVKVRVGAGTSGPNGIVPLHYALEAADRAGLPVMCHIDNPPPRYTDILNELRPGDTLTHCFRPFPNAPIHADGKVREACWQARERGVIFDIAHGKGAFAFEVAEAMLSAGFPPDIISSDVHVLCIDGPAYDNLVTMTKFLNLGLPLPALIRAVTQTPARILNRPDLADLAPGTTADATILRIEDGAFPLTDVLGRTITARQRFTLDSMVVAGHLWHTAA